MKNETEKFHTQLDDSFFRVLLKVGILVFIYWLTGCPWIYQLEEIIITTSILLIIIYVYLYVTSYDITIDSDKLVIGKSFKLFYYFGGEKTFKVNEIENITTLSCMVNVIEEKVRFAPFAFIIQLVLPYFINEYKWIKIKTHDRVYKFYCMGIEYDYFDNQHPTFEDLYLSLAKKGINVKWSHNDSYSKALAEQSQTNLK